MDTNELLNKYCTNLYRIGHYAFTKKEDAQKYLEAHLKCELRGYSHGVIHIPLAEAEGSSYFNEEDFIDAIGNSHNISYDKEEYSKLSSAYFNEDPKISSEDFSKIDRWVEQYNKLVGDIEEVLNSTDVSIVYSRNPERYNNYDFTISGTKSEVEELFSVLYGDEGWVEQKSLTFSKDELDEDSFEYPWRLDIDFKGKYFNLD